MRTKYFLASALLVLAGLALPNLAFAQSLIDAVRATGNELPTGSRNAGLDGALLGAFGGYDALQWNPAALAPLEHADFGLSGLNVGYNSSAAFLGNTLASNSPSTDLASIGIAYPMKTVQGHLAFAVSWDKVRDYTSSYAFDAVNQNSSFLNTQQFVNDPHVTNTSGNNSYLYGNNLAYYLGLTYGVNDSGTESMTTPFGKGLRESGTVTQEGALRALRLGGAIDIAEGLSIGATINLYTGSYNYRRELNETNLGTVRAGDTIPYGFQNAQIVDTRTQTEEGASLKIGLLSYANEIIRFGATIETPTVLTIDDHFHQSGTSNFISSKGTTTLRSSDNPYVEPDVSNSYDVTTPVKFGAGVSLNVLGGLITGSASYADMSQLRFSNWAVDLSDLNDSARLNLRGVFTWQVGAEYMIKPIGLALRAGFGMEPSPYKGDPSSYNLTTFSAGASVLVSKNVALEASYRHASFTTQHLLYSGLTVDNTIVNALVNSDNVTKDEITFGLAYHFR
jgi:hypothetical protein